jgi:hypothetical protein
MRIAVTRKYRSLCHKEDRRSKLSDDDAVSESEKGCEVGFAVTIDNTVFESINEDEIMSVITAGEAVSKFVDECGIVEPIVSGQVEVGVDEQK